MKDKPTKLMVKVDELLAKIDLLDTLIDTDVNNYIQSLDPSKSFSVRKKFRKQSEEAHDTLIKAAKDFSNGN